MTNDSNTTNLTIIVVLILVLIGVSIYAVSSRIFSKEKTPKQENDTEVIEEDTSVVESDIKNTTYEVGSSVILIDSSYWHVIEKSNNDDEYITLLKDIPLDYNIVYNQVNNYLNTTYKAELQKNLFLEDDDLLNLDILSLSQVEDILKTTSLEVGTSLENSSYSWLYAKTTLTSDIDNNNLPILICSRENNDIAKICVGTKEDSWPIRPVITIKKAYIKN